MIDENVKIHDKFSVEIKLGYGTKRSKKINDHIINTWFFIPYSLDINRYTYNKSDFYSDLKTNLRLTTPVYLLRDIAQGENTPFTYLEKSFEQLSTKPIRRNCDEYEYQLKMFHSILKSSLRNEIEHIITNQIAEDREYLIAGYVTYIQEIVDQFRELRRLINAPTVQKKLINYYLLADEFMSNLIEQNTFKLLNSLENNFHVEYKNTKHKLIGLIKRERSYKKSKGYIVVKKETADNNSEVIYRWGVLKKYFESRLYLESRKRKEGVFFEQMLYSVAAGLAMIFATVIAFAVQSKYGNFSIPLFIALVISYMFKDRIKELMRFYFAGKLKNRLFDHKTTIRVKENKIGWCKESFDFVSEDKISKRVSKLRHRSQIMEIEQKSANEQIILYRKFMRVNREKLNKYYQKYEITGVNDIIRFNVSRFVKNMDNPKVPAYVLNDDTCVNIKGDKLYYINMIMKFQNEGNSSYRRYRIAFNRDGIKKVEKL